MALVLQGLGLICPGAETHSCDCIAGAAMLPVVLARAPWLCHSYCGFSTAPVAVARLLQCEGMCFECLRLAKGFGAVHGFYYFWEKNAWRGIIFGEITALSVSHEINMHKGFPRNTMVLWILCIGWLVYWNVMPTFLSFSILNTNYKQEFENNSLIKERHYQMDATASCRSHAYPIGMFWWWG